MTTRLKHLPSILVTVVISLLLLGNSAVEAQQLTNRHVQVLSALPSAVTTHIFQFDIVSPGNIGSIVFEYCENSPVFAYACTAPPGMDADLVTIASQAGNTGFSVDGLNTVANKVVLSRSPLPANQVSSTYALNNITNPSNAPHTEFVRISTYASIDGSGPFIDSGTVAFAINSPLNIDAYIPPFLTFCTGITVALDCSNTNGDSIDLGVIATNKANTATSQFSAATNDPGGYSVYSLGNTMTSGNNIIPALSSPLPSIFGSSQFGINLRANASPVVGQNPSGAGTGTPSANYNFPNFFTYTDGDLIASSSLSSDYTRMTVSYLINASSTQPPGVYSTTITYLAVAQF